MSRRGLIGILFLLLLAAAVTADNTASNPPGKRAKPKVDPLVAQRYQVLTGSINPNALEQTIRVLSTSYPSRVVGYPGADAAGDYVERQFAAAGLEKVRHEDFKVTVPMVHQPGTLEVNGRKYAIHPLWPNLVRTSQLPKAGLRAPLIYAGDGSLKAFNGRDVKDSVVLVDYNTSSNWLNAPRLGAKAVVFIEPDQTSRGESESKFLSIPVALPRFWISKRDAATLSTELQRPETPQAVLKCDMIWESRPAKNILGQITGTDPQMRDQIIVIEAYYDAMSVVPDMAPGAESACGIASLLELVKTFKKYPPKRTVWFLATNGHFIGLQGMKQYLSQHIDKFSAPGFFENTGLFFSNHRRELLLALGILCLLLTAALMLARQAGEESVTQASVVRAGGDPAAPGARRAWSGLLLVVAALCLVVGWRTAPTYRMAREAPEIYLFCGLDLSSQNRGVGIFYKGHFFDFREDIQNKFSDIARVTRENSEKIASVLGLDPRAIFADGVNPIEGKNWRNFIPNSKMAMDAEVWTLAQARGVTFATVDDSRALVDTPFDVIKNVNVNNVALQTKVLACLLDHILNDTNSPGEINVTRMPITEPSSFTRMGLQGGFATVKGRVVKFDLKKSFIPSEPVLGSVAAIRNPNKTFMGVRGAEIQLVDDHSHFSFDGIPPLTAFGAKKPTSVAAYHMNEDGDIDFAPDLGNQGAKAYPIDVDITMATKELSIIVFQCESTTIYDFVDPQGLRTLSDVHLYDGATNAEPRMYGMAVGKPERFQAVVEDAAVFFAQPGFTIKVIMGAGPAATRFVLINPVYEGKIPNIQPKVPEGIGYKLGKQHLAGEKPPELQNVAYNTSYEGTIPNIPLQVASDMWVLDDFRIKQLAKYRIINQGLDNLHKRAGDLITTAQKSLDEKQYDKADSYSRAAWGYEARAYPDVQKTARDVVKGLMFYLALLLPFAFFAERLMIAAPQLRHQIVGFFGIFIGVFLLFRFIHPAFDITTSPLIVLLAFVMLSLSVLVITLISGKFEQQLKEFNKTISGVHKADVGRMSVAAAAFSLGISNMRRRKARTVLTCMTLVLLTFIVLSFTSVVSGMRFNVVPAPGQPRYDGIMLRTAMWDSLEESSFRLLNDEFGLQHPVAPRAWFFGTQPGEQTFLSLTRGDKTFNARAILGLSPQESKVTEPQKALIAGRWFQPGDVYAAVLPKEVADALSISVPSVESHSASFRYGGIDFQVIGIVDNDNFKAMKDLDQEPLTPVDFILMQRQSQQSGGGAGGGAEAGFREYTHLEPNTIVMMPYQTLMNLGGEVRSVAINFLSQSEVDRIRKELMPRLGLNLYAGQGGKTYRYSSIGSTSIAGAGTLFVPILIAALIVLNTMLGSVFERQREIGIFSAIGLAPNHVAMLFMAESMVYAVIGAIAGYVLGQGTAKIIVALNVLQGLNLNFSSVSAVFSTALVMGVVLLSTLYPARKASEVATPAIERSWRTPDPVGDNWEIPLPFAVTGDQATGLNGFLSEWFKAYEEYSIGDFVTQNVESTEGETELGKSYQIRLQAWLAPFDLGVSQQVVLDTLPTEMEDVFEIRITIHRVSGDISNWKRVNRRFLNTLRKQFLIWRTLGHEERERYLEPAQEAATA